VHGPCERLRSLRLDHFQCAGLARYDASSQAWGEAMRRRDFITGIAGSSVAWPLVARGEASPRRPLIAVLTAITKENNAPLNDFVQGLKELGYVDGVNVDCLPLCRGTLGSVPCTCSGIGRT
jgi:hypothetical protein